MILELALGASIVAGAAYYAKHHASSATVVAVKAEIAKIEADIVSGNLYTEGKTAVLSVVARSKALL